jgi:hypothetical protein
MQVFDSSENVFLGLNQNKHQGLIYYEVKRRSVRKECLVHVQRHVLEQASHFVGGKKILLT